MTESLVKTSEIEGELLNVDNLTGILLGLTIGHGNHQAVVEGPGRTAEIRAGRTRLGPGYRVRGRIDNGWRAAAGEGAVCADRPRRGVRLGAVRRSGEDARGNGRRDSRRGCAATSARRQALARHAGGRYQCRRSAAGQ